MSFNYENLVECQKGLATAPIKGKDYVMVNERVKAFRKLCPEGTIETDILSVEDGVCVIKATIFNDGKIISTGHAYEKEQSSFINKTSYIENCETSAVGRALGFLGIGIDGGMASAEEVANAVMNQGEPKKTFKEVAQANVQKNQSADNKISAAQFKQLNDLMVEKGFKKEDCDKIKAAFEIKNLKDLTSVQFDAFVTKIESMTAA